MEKQTFWSSPRNNFLVGGLLGVFIGLVIGLGFGIYQMTKDTEENLSSAKMQGELSKKAIDSCMANFAQYTVLYDTTADPQGAPSIPLLHGLVSLSLGPATTSKTGARWLIPAKIAPQIVGANPNNAARYLWIDAHTGEIKSQVFLPVAFSGGGGGD